MNMLLGNQQSKLKEENEMTKALKSLANAKHHCLWLCRAIREVVLSLEKSL